MPTSTNPTSPLSDNAKAASEPPKEPITEDLTVALDVWCGNKSRTLGRRVEALSAFYRICARSGKTRKTVEEFEADFKAFLATPA